MIPIVGDFETFYGKGYSLSLKEMTTQKYIHDKRFKVHGIGLKVKDKPSVWVPEKYIPQALEKVKMRENALVGHNLQFDGAIMAWKYGVVPKLYLDTLAMARALVGHNTGRHGLKYIAEALCGMTKMNELERTYDVRNLSPALERALADYCTGAPRMKNGRLEAGDTELTYAIFMKMIPHLPREEIYAIDWTIRAFTCPSLTLDTKLLDEYIDELAEQKQKALDEAGLSSRDVLMSNPMYAEALERFGVVPPTKINKKGKVAFAFAKTDADHIALLDHPDIRVQSLVAARLEHKSTIAETRAAHYRFASELGPWPVAYSYAGAKVTQRFSGNMGGGGNPQNLPRGGTLRRAIHAALGHVVGVADLSQIEARIVLWLGMQITGPDGEEAKALKVMEEGGDIYGWFGERIYGYPIHKGMPERHVAKAAVLGLGYGMGWERFIEHCRQQGVKGVDEQFARDIVKLYRSTFKGVAKFWRQCTKAINLMIDGQFDVALPFSGISLVTTGLDPLFNNPSLLRPCGLRIKYPDLSKDAEGEITYFTGHVSKEGKQTRSKLFGGKICENIVQAVAGDVLRSQLKQLNKHYFVSMNTHDELVCMIPEDDADLKEWDEEKEIMELIEPGNFSLIATEIMTKPVEYLPGLPLAIEVDTAFRYGEAK